MAALTWRVIGSNSMNGPLLQGVSTSQAIAWALQGRTDLLAQAVNQALAQAELALPEGTPVQLDISGWTVPGGSLAQYVAGQIQQAYVSGRIIDPNTHGVPDTWPEFPGQLAWGSDATDTVTLRWVKRPAWAVWIVVGIVIVLAALALVYLLQRANWQAQAGFAQGGATSPAGPSVNPLPWLLHNWQWVLVGLAALAVAPFAIRQLGATTVAAEETAQELQRTF